MGSSVDVHREGKRNDDTPAPMRLVIDDDVDPGFIRDRSGRERRRPVLPTGPWLLKPPRLVLSSL